MSLWYQADIIKLRCLKIQNSSVKTSEDEITFLTGGDDPYDDNVVLTKLFHPNLSILVVTEGSEGCRYYTPNFRGRVAGVKPVDTTGPGDAFVSGILNSIASDSSLFQRLTVAAVCEVAKYFPTAVISWRSRDKIIGK